MNKLLPRHFASRREKMNKVSLHMVASDCYGLCHQCWIRCLPFDAIFTALCTNPRPLPACHPSSWQSIGLPGVDLRLRSVGSVSLKFRTYIPSAGNVRAVRLVRAPSKRPVGDVIRLSPAAGCLADGVLVWRRVNSVGHPRMPERLDLGAV